MFKHKFQENKVQTTKYHVKFLEYKLYFRISKWISLSMVQINLPYMAINDLLICVTSPFKQDSRFII